MLERVKEILQQIIQSFSPEEAIEEENRSGSVPPPFGHRPRQAAAIGRWIPPGQSVTVASYTFSAGMVYVGDGLAGLSSYLPKEPCLICPQLPVSQTPLSKVDVAMTYWPSYHQVSPGARGAYLSWLAGGRTDLNVPSGALLLFLFGLERRVFKDLGQERSDPVREEARCQELGAIAIEVERLLSLYPQHDRFRQQAEQFLGVCRLPHSAERCYNTEPPFSMEGSGFPLTLTIALGQLAMEGKPLPADWALSWYVHSPDAKLRTPASRCLEELRCLFQLRYEQRYKSGLKLRAGNNRLQVSYQPISPTFGPLRSAIEINLGQLPDVTEQTVPLRKLRRLVEDCTKELDPFSRWLGRNPNGAKIIAAMALLPAEIAASYPLDETVQPLLQWVQQSLAGTNSAAIAGAEVLQYWPDNAAEKLTKANATMLSQFLEKQGYGIEPDVRFGGKLLTKTAPAILFRLPAGTVLETLSAEYEAAAVLLNLAVAVATSYGQISDAQQSSLEAHLEAALHLSGGERSRLQAHLQWLLQKKPGLRGLKSRLGMIPVARRAGIGRFLVSVAGADGHISPAEISVLSKIYPWLDLDPKAVYSDIHDLSTAPVTTDVKTSPVTVRPASPLSPGYAIPAEPESDGDGSSPAQSNFVLDMNLVQSKLSESAAVSDLLSGIFAEEEIVVQANPTQSNAQSNAQSVAEPGIAGLDAAHSQFLRSLAQKPIWQRQQLEALASETDLLLDGALEAINEIAFDQCDEALTEGNDAIEVNADVLEELLS